MMETYLLTKSIEHKDAWIKQIPQMWDFTCRECPDVVEDYPADDLQEMDNGKLTKTNRMMYVFLSQEGGTYVQVLRKKSLSDKLLITCNVLVTVRLA